MMKEKLILTLLMSIMLVAGCGQKDEAKPIYQGSVQKRDYVAMGVQLLQKGDVLKAIQSFDEAIKQDPTNPEKYLVLGQVYYQLKRYDRAVDTLAAAARIAPTNGDVHYMLALNMALDGRTKEALTTAQQSVEIFTQQKNEEMFKKSLALLRGIQEGTVQE